MQSFARTPGFSFSVGIPMIAAVGLVALLCVQVQAADDQLTSLIHALESADGGERIAAAMALGDLGASAKPAAPALAKSLKDDDAPVRLFAARALIAIGDAKDRETCIPVLVAELDGDLADEAAHTLSQLGAAVVPALKQVLLEKDPNRSDQAAQILSLIGRPAIPTILALAGRSERDEAHWHALDAFDALTVDDLRDQLLRETHNPDAAVRAGAAYFLHYSYVLPAAQAKPALERLLEDDSSVVRAGAIESLGAIGLPAADLADAIIHMMHQEDEDPLVRRRCVLALRHLVSQDRAIAELVTILNAPHASLRAVAVAQIGVFGAHSTETTGRVLEVLQDESLTVRLWAVSSLANIGHQAAVRQGIPVLIQGLESEHPGDRRFAASLLDRVAPVAQQAVPMLVGVLDDEEPSVRIYAIEALGQIGAQAKPGVPSLIRLLMDPDPMVRQSATRSVGKLASHTVARAPLHKQLNDSDEHVQIEAMKAIGGFGSLAKGSAEFLLDRLTSPSDRIRESAVAALGNIGAPAQQSIPAIAKTLVRLKYVSLRDVDLYSEAIGKIGRSDAQSAEPLAELLPHANPWVRLVAAEAWIETGLDARAAANTLITLLEEDAPELAGRALSALAKTGTAAGVARPTLRKILTQAPLPTRLRAAWTLYKTDSNANPKALDVLWESFQNADARNRLLAAELLVDIDEHTEEIASELLPMLGSSRGSDPNQVPLETNFGDGSPEMLRAQIVRVLGNVRPVSPEIVEALTKTIREDAMVVARSAIDALGQMGPDARHAVPTLEETLFDLSLRAAAKQALARIDETRK